MGDNPKVKFANRNYRKNYEITAPTANVRGVEESTLGRGAPNTNKSNRIVRKLAAGHTRRNNAGILNRAQALKTARAEAGRGINYRALAPPSIALARGKLDALHALVPVGPRPLPVFEEPNNPVAGASLGPAASLAEPNNPVAGASLRPIGPAAIFAGLAQPRPLAGATAPAPVARSPGQFLTYNRPNPVSTSRVARLLRNSVASTRQLAPAPSPLNKRPSFKRGGTTRRRRHKK